MIDESPFALIYSPLRHINRLVAALSVAFALVAAVSPQTGSADQVRVAVATPLLSAYPNLGKAMDTLRARTRYRYTLSEQADEAAVIRGLLRRDFEFALIGPVAYLMANGGQRDIVPLTHFGDSEGVWQVRCALVHFPDDPLDLQLPQRVAAGRELGPCGPHAAVALLEPLEGWLGEIAFQGSAVEAALSVLRGQQPMAVVPYRVAATYRHLALQVAALGEPLPEVTLVADSSHVNLALQRIVTVTLIEYLPRDESTPRAYPASERSFAPLDQLNLVVPGVEFDD